MSSVSSTLQDASGVFAAEILQLFTEASSLKNFNVASKTEAIHPPRMNAGGTWSFT